MTPHELINLRGYGQATKRVKAMGMWRETMTDTERIDWLSANADCIMRLDHNQSWKITIEPKGYDGEFFREDIDSYATTHTQELYIGYLED